MPLLFLRREETIFKMPLVMSGCYQLIILIDLFVSLDLFRLLRLNIIILKLLSSFHFYSLVLATIPATIR